MADFLTQYLTVKNIIYDYQILNVEKKVAGKIYPPHNHRLTVTDTNHTYRS